MPRGHSKTGANPDRVMARIAERFNLQHADDPPEVNADTVLPADLMADPAATRAAIAKLGR